jgi:hypothetical protein
MKIKKNIPKNFVYIRNYQKYSLDNLRSFKLPSAHCLHIVPKLCRTAYQIVESPVVVFTYIE